MPEVYHYFQLDQPWPAAHPLMEPSGIGSAGQGGSFKQVLTEATSVVCLLPQTRSCKPKKGIKKDKTKQNKNVTRAHRVKKVKRS